MHIESVEIRGIEFGKGKPKICVPIVEKNKNDILNQATRIMKMNPDCLELRVDFYRDVMDKDKVLDLLKNLRKIVGNLVIIFTFRTDHEGGNLAITKEDYKKICEYVCESGYIDILDVEVYMQRELTNSICNRAHENGVYVLGSYHNFKDTPSQEEIVERLQYMDEQGVDFPKIAVMPKEKRDVLTVLSATLLYYELGYSKPIITISMSSLGIVTRLFGEIVGSVITFVTVGKPSAPGQIPMEDASRILEIIHIYK